MTTNDLFSASNASVKQALISTFADSVGSVLAQAESDIGARELEQKVVELVFHIGRAVLAEVMSTRCKHASLQDQQARGLPPTAIRYRAEDGYQWSLTTTLGKVVFPCWAYRSRAVVGSVTRSPAQLVFPLRSKCKSSELCLEWEARLASICPYRSAEQLLAFFSHGSTVLQDTTIASHATRVGHAIEQRWLFQSPEVTRGILADDATRDRVTDRPLLYVSNDAHALRRYANESFTARWKMINGLRVWCMDKRTGQVIHIGGQFISGDAHRLSDELKRLIEDGVLPRDGDFGGGTVATYVFVADGMPWIADLLISQLPGAVAILDAYHVLERLAAHARDQWGAKTIEAKHFMARARQLLFGDKPTPHPNKPQYRRKGHRKRKRAELPPPIRALPLPATRVAAGEALLAWLLASDDSSDAHQKLVNYVRPNAYRMDYVLYRHHGMQIGSGAMESLHVTGSQSRLKLAGTRWLPETIDALLNLRMLGLSGRWDEFFGQPRLWQDIHHRFKDVAYHTVRGCPLAA